MSEPIEESEKNEDSEESEEEKKIKIVINYVAPNFIATMVQLFIFAAGFIVATVFIFANLLELAADSEKFMFHFKSGLFLMFAGILIAVVPFMIIGYMSAKVKKEEEIEDFHKKAKRLVFDRSAISWVVFITGLVLLILGFF